MSPAVKPPESCARLGRGRRSAPSLPHCPRTSRSVLECASPLAPFLREREAQPDRLPRLQPQPLRRRITCPRCLRQTYSGREQTGL